MKSLGDTKMGDGGSVVDLLSRGKCCGSRDRMEDEGTKRVFGFCSGVGVKSVMLMRSNCSMLNVTRIRSSCRCGASTSFPRRGAIG